MVFTDPPYNVLIAGNVSGLGKVTHREFGMASGEMSRPAFTAFLRAAMTDGKAPPASPIDAPQALRLHQEPVADVGRYDDLRELRQPARSVPVHEV